MSVEDGSQLQMTELIKIVNKVVMAQGHVYYAHVKLIEMRGS